MDVIRSEIVLEEGYKITNECLPKSFRQKDVDEKCTNPGIRMRIESCNDMDAFMESLKQCHYDDVPDNWYDILFGKLPGWQLCTVTVTSCSLIFDFVNPELERQKQELRKAGKDEELWMIESDGYAILELDSFHRRSYMKMRFEATTPVGGISNTVVEVECQKATVTKFLPYGYRVYEIMGTCDFLGRSDDGFKAILTEYLL